MAKNDYIRTPDGNQRIVEGHVKVSKTLFIPVFVAEPTINDNPDEPGAIGINASNELMLYVDGDWKLSTQTEATARAAADTALTSSLSGKVDKITGKGLSDENYSSTEKAKLATLSEHFVGVFASLAALQAAHPTGVDGNYATVESSGVPGVTYIWDTINAAWELGNTGVVTSVNTHTGAVSLTTDDVPEGTNKYYAGSLFNASLATKTTDNLTEGTTNKYYASSLFNTDLATKSTTNLTEGTNLYFTLARVLAAVLTGISFVTNSPILSTDTLLAALGKLQAQISALITGKQDALGYTAENTANKGVAGGYAGLDGTGKVPAAQLPSYVDDVIEGANLAAFPGTGETGKIYVALDTNIAYRWTGSTYLEIVASPGTTDAITEGSTNKFFTNARAIASPLTGYSAGAGTVGASDTIEQGIQKVDGNSQANAANIATNTSNIASNTSAIATKQNSFAPTAVKNVDYNAVANDLVPVDTTGANRIVNLPTAPADAAIVGVKHVIQGGTNIVTINTGGSDVFNKAGGSTSVTLPFANEGYLFQYKASTGIWYIISNDIPLTALDARFVQQGAAGAITNAMLAGSITTDKLQNSGDNTLRALQLLGSSVKGHTFGHVTMPASNAIGLTNGTIHWTAFYLPVAATIASLKYDLSTAFSGTSTGFNGVALYSISGGTLTQIAVSTTVTANTIWGGATGFRTINFASSVALTEGVYFVAMLYQASAETTQPKLIAISIPAGGYPGLDLTNSVKIAGTTTGTTLPSSQAVTGFTAGGTLYFGFLV